jgi:plasmid stabilization system protein ParE
MYPSAMTKTLKAVLERAATWPEWAQDDLAQLALEIDQEVSAGTYRATREELAKIDEALAAVRRGEVASADESRRCSRSIDEAVLSRLALAELDEILGFIRERSPTGARNVEARIRRAFDHIANHPKRPSAWSSGRRCAPAARALSLCHLLRGRRRCRHILRILHWCAAAAVGEICSPHERSDMRG